ncbi:MAG: 2,3-bisphosphoglycerate-independent phosphoglycerate mutase [Flavobacteriales bacterium]
MENNKKVVLMILDGWGLGDGSPSDAVHCARTPFMDELTSHYPTSQLRTDGDNVGLPAGQMGNSEVGHLNIGAGRIVYQDLVRINKAVDEDTLKDNEALNEAIDTAKTRGCGLHFMGLVSPGGIHSHQEHLYYLCKLASMCDVQDIYVHAFTDGRDCDPHSGLEYLDALLQELSGTNAELVSVVGRYYAMDRDKRWERIKRAYDMLRYGNGKHTTDLIKAVRESYAEGISDEFIQPIVKTDRHGNPVGRIREGDVVVCFNFRTDRCRELTKALVLEEMPEHGLKTLGLHYVTMTKYDESFTNIPVIFDKANLQNTIGEVISSAGLKQLRIAETEKYPHVTFFFSGGREKPFEGEDRILVNSPKVATYDMQPEMSALEVSARMCAELKKQDKDFICINYANSDMVGHTGVYQAILKAVETVDTCVKQVVDCGRQNGYSFIIIADHGNSDHAINADGSPNTAHSMNPVPCILVDGDYECINDGILADIAPTILSLMNLDIPSEMSGKILVPTE